MKVTASTILIGIAVVLGLFVMTTAISYNGFINDATSYEVSVKAKYTDNKNVRDNGVKKIKEMAQVPALQEAQLEKLAVAAISARQYDKGGQLMKFITEQNPNMDQTTFIKIQQAVEEYRNSFQRAQTELISQKQSYETFLTATTNGRFNNGLAGMLGSKFPRVDMSQFEIVTSDDTENVFKTKREEPLKLQ
jgi:hypothetical protein